MDRSRLIIDKIIHLIIILAVIASMTFIYKDMDLRYYVLFLLLFLLNAQIRINFLKGKLFLLSLVLDMALLSHMYIIFGGLSYILFYISLMDGMIFLKEEGYIIAGIILIITSYLLRPMGGEAVLLNTLISFILFSFAYQIRRLTEKVEEVECLYDQNRRYSYQLEDVKKRLEDYSKKVEGVSQLEERNRISRDIHDNIGHKLTGVLFQLEAAIRVMEADNQRGIEMLNSVRDNMHSCTEILRQTVRSMKPKEYSGRLLSIQQMLRDFSKNTGISISFEVIGNPVKLYPSGEVTLYKNAQEAVTNAARHGRATYIEARLIYQRDKVILAIKDDGIGCSTITKGMGIGGMEERVTLIGGELQIINSNGFEVRTIVPVR